MSAHPAGGGKAGKDSNTSSFESKSYPSLAPVRMAVLGDRSREEVRGSGRTAAFESGNDAVEGKPRDLSLTRRGQTQSIRHEPVPVYPGSRGRHTSPPRLGGCTSALARRR